MFYLIICLRFSLSCTPCKIVYCILQFSTEIIGAAECYVALGLNELDASKPVKQEPTLQIYKEYFEAPFIDDTEHYYSRESNEFLRQNPITEYMKRVEVRLEEEKKRIRLYLNESTEEVLLKKCEEVLIKRHLDLFYSEFENLLNDCKNDDLARMYNLVSFSYYSFL